MHYVSVKDGFHSCNTQKPAGLLFTFTLPVVDAEDEEEGGGGEEWNTWFHVLRVLTVLGFFMSVTRCKLPSM